ncbi:MAG: hypothetical protein IPM96_16035 [Ignavibacteria bacterium]|nr:hypothetical protein [Ignavibacteria bacterium]
MKEIVFTYNWNNKLDCKCFTSIRMSDTYRVGDEYKVFLRSGKDLQVKGVAEIMDIKAFYLDQLSMFIAYLDTGYSVSECKNIIYRMYPNIELGSQKLRLILFKYK